MHWKNINLIVHIFYFFELFRVRERPSLKNAHITFTCWFLFLSFFKNTGENKSQKILSQWQHFSPLMILYLVCDSFERNVCILWLPQFKYEYEAKNCMWIINRQLLEWSYWQLNYIHLFQQTILFFLSLFRTITCVKCSSFSYLFQN